MPAVKFFACLDLDQIDLFLDGHYLLKVETRNARLILMSAIDNRVKGAAGQAVQNLNIMLGIEQNASLWQPPYSL